MAASFVDTMIAASAVHAGCDTLWPEDMQHGMVLDDGLHIVDPFRAEPGTLQGAASVSRTRLAAAWIRHERELIHARPVSSGRSAFQNSVQLPFNIATPTGSS
jgi:hypothetical protein